MQTRDSAYRVLTILILLALPLGNAPIAYTAELLLASDDTPRPDLHLVRGIPSGGFPAGNSFTVEVDAWNLGGTSENGAINVSVLYSDETHDVTIDNVSAPWADLHLVNFSPGEGSLWDNNCEQLPDGAVDHVVEAAESDWTQNESHTLSFQVTPQKAGTLWVRVRTTMKGDGSCEYYNDHSVSGADSPVDQQGWRVAQFVVAITGPSLTLDNYGLYPSRPSVAPGGAFTVHYRINNPGSTDQTIYLLARARESGGDDRFLETSSGVSAVPVTVTPGSGWYEREAVVYDNAPEGTYGLTWFISPTPNWSDYLDAESDWDAFDVEIPHAENVELVGHFGGDIRTVAVQGSYAYVTDNGYGLRVLDISDPANPTQVGFLPADDAWDIALYGNYAYLACDVLSLWVVDISDPSSPTEVMWYYENPYIEAYRGVAAAEGYLYIADYAWGLRVVGISDPARPGPVGFCNAIGATDVAVAEGYAYVIDSAHNLLRVIDVSDPSNPTQVATLETYAWGVAVAGDYAYVVGNSLQVVDISIPSSPNEVSSYPLGATHVAVAGDYAYVAGYGGLGVVDVSDPDNLRLVGYYDMPGEARHVAVAGGHVYVAAKSGGLFVLSFAGGLVNPTALDFGTTLTELALSINPENPTDAWTLSESIPWLTLSSTSGTGSATVTVSVDREGLPDGTYNDTINANVGGEAVTVDVTMRVVTPDVAILAPAQGSNARAADTFLARASVEMDSAPLIGAQVDATIPLGGPWAVSGSLYDDGQHEDGSQNDGIYAAFLTLPAPTVMPPGSYTLIITATAEGASGADDVGFNVIGGYSGVPTVTVTVDGPNAPDLVRGDVITVTTTVTYPDASIHTDTDVMVTFVLPDFTLTQMSPTNVSDDTWRGTYTLPQGGHYWVDVRAEPPPSTDFIDGYGGTDMDVYEGDLALMPTSFGGPYPLYGRVPLSLCVTSGSVPFEEATIRATVTGPGGYKRTVGSFNSPSSGCYEAVSSPRVSGQHVVTYTARAYPYRPVTTTLSFQVLTQSSRLKDRVLDFGSAAVDMADLTMTYIVTSAVQGQHFANEREADERRLVADAIVGITSLSIDAVGAVDAIAESRDAYLPASEVIFGSKLASQAEEHFLLGLGELGAEASLEVMANRLRKGPAAFYAADGDAEDMLTKFENGHAISVTIQEDLAEKDGFQEHFVNVLQPVVNKVESDIAANTTNLAANLPPFTLGQEQAYIHDLDGRHEANWWLVPQAVNYERSPLHEAYEQRTESHFLEHIAEFLLWGGAKIVAFAICDGPCSLGVSAGKVLVDAIVNAEKLSEDGRMMNLGTDLMEMGFWEERRLWSNTLSGLDVISRSDLPDTPQGQIETIDFRENIIITDRGTGKMSVYADITIVNTGTVTARFFPIAYGENGDLLKKADTLVDPAAPDTSLAPVELAPGASTTVRLIFFRRDWNSNLDDEPKLDTGVLINLFAQTNKGVYLVDDLYEESYHPEHESGGSMSNDAQVSVQYLSENKATRAQTNDEPDGPEFDFPLAANVGTNEGSSTYNVWVLAHNPFPGPMAVVLSQTVPSGVEVLQVTDGAASGGEIRWYKIIQPHESVAVGYQFQPAAGNYGDDITLPPVNMSYYDAMNDAIVTLSTGVGQVAGKLPLFAEGVPPQYVPPDTQTSVTIDVTNLDDSQSHQGSLYLSLMDLTGIEVASASANVSLSAGDSQAYPLTFTTPDMEGTYIMKVTLTQNGTTATIFTTFVEVRTQRIYLPLVLRNYTPGTGPTTNPPYTPSDPALYDGAPD
jgi:hypothetical protein